MDAFTDSSGAAVVVLSKTSILFIYPAMEGTEPRINDVQNANHLQISVRTKSRLKYRH